MHHYMVHCLYMNLILLTSFVNIQVWGRAILLLSLWLWSSHSIPVRLILLKVKGPGPWHPIQYKSLAVLTKRPRMFSWQRMMPGVWELEAGLTGRSVGSKSSIYKLVLAESSMKINTSSLVGHDSGILQKENWRPKGNRSVLAYETDY